MQLIIRADASTASGTGHLMRCLALAQAWQEEGGEALFVTACESENLSGRIESEGFNLIRINKAHPDPADWAETEKVLGNHPGAWIVLDGYHFDPAYQKNIKGMGHKLLVIDDMAHLVYYFADIILNQNIGAEIIKYQCEPETKLLLGTRFALLRREFFKWRGFKRDIPQVARKILVTMGGGDPDNVTLKVLQAIDMLEIADLEIKAVVGAANPHFKQISAFSSRSKHRIAVKEATENMAKLIAWADLAVSAGGSTCWEMAFMGLPAMVIITASNQELVAKGLGMASAVENLGQQGEIDTTNLSGSILKLIHSKSERMKMSISGRKLVDGYGAIRLRELIAEEIYLRSVTINDLDLLYRWANDSETRKQSFKSEPIDYNTHKEWFANKINDPFCSFYLCFNSLEVTIGQIRFDVDKNSVAVIDVSVDCTQRGNGYGSKIISSGIRKLKKERPIKQFLAFVKTENYASLTAFKKANFIEINTTLIDGHNTAILEWRESC